MKGKLRKLIGVSSVYSSTEGGSTVVCVITVRSAVAQGDCA